MTTELLLSLLSALFSGVVLLVLLTRRGPVNAGLSLEDVRQVAEAQTDKTRSTLLDGIERLNRNLTEILATQATVAKSDTSVLKSDLTAQVTAMQVLVKDSLERAERASADSMAKANEASKETLRLNHDSVYQQLELAQKTTVAMLSKIQEDQMQRSEAFQTKAETTYEKIQQNLDAKLKEMRDEVGAKLFEMRSSNEAKLEEMRVTVDEKLNDTLTKRLGESFGEMDKRLQSVHESLGKVDGMGSSITRLNNVMSNVKTLGIVGEWQLADVVTSMLTSEQYAKEFVIPGTREKVEFAVVMPGKSDGEPVYLPIDSKFPLSAYESIIQAVEESNVESLKAARTRLSAEIRKYAGDICNKYLGNERTTEFGILFLPTEGLYAEVLNQAGLFARVQQECNIMIAGPSTLAALLNSLRMGFRTLAIEQRSSEVRETLGAFKKEFENWIKLLDKAQKASQSTTKHIEDLTGKRTRAIQRTLRRIEIMPSDRTAEILGINELGLEDPDDLDEDSELVNGELEASTEE
jgi:DNA recombination protein RmuC